MVRIVAVGVGEYQDFEGQLEEIEGENVYIVNNFDELPDLFEDILKETCSKYKGCSVLSDYSTRGASSMEACLHRAIQKL